MINKIFFWSLVVFVKVLHAQDDQSSMALALDAKQKQKGLLKIVLINPSPELTETAQLLEKILRCSAWKTIGFSVTLETQKKMFSKNRLKKECARLCKCGHLALLCLKQDEADSLEWCLVDVQAGQAIKSKRFTNAGSSRSYAEHIADELWQTLTGQEGFFSTRIAFCKEIVHGKKRFKKVIMTTPYCNDLNEHQKELIGKGNVFALHWNEDIERPALFYSEITNRNVRLMSITPDGKRKIVSNYDGLNLFPSSSAQGTKAVLCLTQHGNTQLFLYERNPLTNIPLKQITFQGNNLCPSLCDNNDIIFCSDARGKPQICRYCAATETIEYVTNDGYCTSPTYCKKNNKIVYHKLIDGTMQLMLYDLTSKNHQQLTFDDGDKQDCSWSSCGNFITFTVDQGKTSRIALLNLASNERVYVTAANDRCNYPTWSARYAMPIAI